MANCIIYKKNSNTISYFIKDCTRDNNNYLGSNKKIFGIKPKHFDIKWTNEDIDPIFDKIEKNNIVGWKKKISEIEIIEDPIDYIKEFKTINIEELANTDSKQLLIKVAYTLQDILRRKS